MTVDYVIKLGGSLLNDIAAAGPFIAKLAGTRARCVFTVGSGPLGDSFTALGLERQTALPFDLSVECWSALQSINARLLCAMSNRLVLAPDYASASCGPAKPTRHHRRLPPRHPVRPPPPPDGGRAGRPDRP